MGRVAVKDRAINVAILLLLVLELASGLGSFLVGGPAGFWPHHAGGLVSDCVLQQPLKIEAGYAMIPPHPESGSGRTRRASSAT